MCALLFRSLPLPFVIPAHAGIKWRLAVKRDFQPCVYIIASRRNGTIYTGVTSDLVLRMHQHREGLTPGFATKHGAKTLVWFEQHSTMEHAITREKRIKKWIRVWKLELIEKENLS